MADLRATQAYQGTPTGTSPTTVYTVPTGKRFILKQVALQEISGVATDVQVRVGSIGTITRQHLASYGSGGDSAVLYYWLVLNAGDVIQLNRTVSGSINAQVSGSLHTV